MKKAAFSLCSNNYLAKALVAVDSFLSHHPEYHFTLILVDRFSPEITYPTKPNLSIIEVGSFVSNINDLAQKYNIIELNTAVKARSFLHLFDTYSYSWILYLDPDLIILGRFTELEQLLQTEQHNIILTPHGCSPIDDGKIPSEIDLITYGIFNLGFIAVANTRESRRFLEWWHARLMKYCYMQPDNGMFTDQLWVNYAPIYFSGVLILKNPGYNAANWNLYERNLTRAGDKYLINDHQELRFFHFSHYKYENPYIISYHQNRHNIKDLSALKELIDDYQARLTANNQLRYQTIGCYYAETHKNSQRRSPLRSLASKCRHALKIFRIASGRSRSPKK